MKTAPEQVVWYKTHKANETAVLKESPIVKNQTKINSTKEDLAEKNRKEWAEYYKNYPQAAIAAGYVPPAPAI